MLPIVNSPQGNVERRHKLQFVVELQFADNVADAIERDLIVHYCHHTHPIRLALGAGQTLDDCGHFASSLQIRVVFTEAGQEYWAADPVVACLQ
jgi:hypothetical protein